jgi:hypothetical protein
MDSIDTKFPTDKWKSLINVDAPDYDIPCVSEDRRTGQLHTIRPEYEEKYRKMVLDTKLP